eukprot:4352068-Pyramimonas_sp.AAC.1
MSTTRMPQIGGPSRSRTRTSHKGPTAHYSQRRACRAISSSLVRRPTRRPRGSSLRLRFGPQPFQVLRRAAMVHDVWGMSSRRVVFAVGWRGSCCGVAAQFVVE